MENQTTRVTARCPIRTTLELVGGKWKLLIMIQLVKEPLRLSELKRQIPDISEKMLIQELKNLVDSKLVERKNFSEASARIEYELTATGHTIMPLIKEMTNFAIGYENKMKSN